MNTTDLTRAIAAVLEGEPACERVQDFEDAGIVSSADGLVMHTGGGDEFRITVVQTRYAPAKTIHRLRLSRARRSPR
jgi:hypothetical protein